MLFTKDPFNLGEDSFLGQFGMMRQHEDPDSQDVNQAQNQLVEVQDHEIPQVGRYLDPIDMDYEDSLCLFIGEICARPSQNQSAHSSDTAESVLKKIDDCSSQKDPDYPKEKIIAEKKPKKEKKEKKAKDPYSNFLKPFAKIIISYLKTNYSDIYEQMLKFGKFKKFMEEYPSCDDFQFVLTHQMLRQPLETMFRCQHLKRDFMTSRTQPENKIAYMRNIAVFEKGFEEQKFRKTKLQTSQSNYSSQPKTGSDDDAFIF